MVLFLIYIKYTSNNSLDKLNILSRVRLKSGFVILLIIWLFNNANSVSS